jgi:hypothetical protein
MQNTLVCLNVAQGRVQLYTARNIGEHDCHLLGNVFTHWYRIIVLSGGHPGRQINEKKNIRKQA